MVKTEFFQMESKYMGFIPFCSQVFISLTIPAFKYLVWDNAVAALIPCFFPLNNSNFKLKSASVAPVSPRHALPCTLFAMSIICLVKIGFPSIHQLSLKWLFSLCYKIILGDWFLKNKGRSGSVYCDCLIGSKSQAVPSAIISNKLQLQIGQWLIYEP